MNVHLTPSRRDFLKGSGALIVAFSLLPRSEALAQAQTDIEKPVTLDQVDTFLAIDDKGMVTVYAGKVDLGTGIRIGIQQIVAEELDVPLATVTSVEGDTALTPDQGPTYGSQSIQTGGMQIRQAAATARSALLDMAAQQLNAAKEDLVVADGVVTSKSGDGRVTFAELIGGKTFMLKVDTAARAKDPADYKIVGKPIARRDIPEKLTGRFTYMQDFRVPGMLHGSVVRPPAIGATLQSVDESSIKDIPGCGQDCPRGKFPRRRNGNRMGSGSSRARDQGIVVGIRNLAGSGEALGPRSFDRDREGRRHEQYRRYDCGNGCGRQKAQCNI
jgi:xanthine dehydrogenase molybdopterin-binding subunit B